MKEAEGLDPLFPLKIECNFKNKQQNRGLGPGVAGGGGRYCHVWAIWVCVAIEGMVFKQFTLG